MPYQRIHYSGATSVVCVTLAEEVDSGVDVADVAEET
jgi:hypothetical protein